MERLELIFHGYCKVRNESRDMHFLYEVDDGEYALLKGDCDFDRCRYSGECSIIREAFAKEEE